MPQAALNLAMLNQFSDLYIWKKDLNLNFVDLNNAAAQAFGFDDIDAAIGKSDYDIPSGLSEFSDVFRTHDTNVIKSAKTLKFLEIQPCANDSWKVLQVEKIPCIENGTITGVIGYSIDITKTYMQLDNFLLRNENYENNSIKNNKLMINLTLRESECLFFLLRKCTAKEIARILNLSYRTVEHYIDMLKLKFCCKTSLDLLQVAQNQGYFNIIPPSILQKQLSIVIG